MQIALGHRSFELFHTDEQTPAVSGRADHIVKEKLSHPFADKAIRQYDLQKSLYPDQAQQSIGRDSDPLLTRLETLNLVTKKKS